jgi:hypothetical protein
MVKTIIILFISSVNIFFSYKIEAQEIDSIKCDEYFSRLNEVEMVTLWSNPPVFKEEYTSVLCELCNKISIDSTKYLMTTLILDKKGDVVCIKIYPNIESDSLKNVITDLLFKIKFEPAIGYKNPVVSHYILLFNNQRCKLYEDMNRRKQKTKKCK